MSLTRIALVAALGLIGCGGDGGANDDVSNTSSNTPNNVSNSMGGTPDRPTLVEPDGCFAEPARTVLEGEEVTYTQQTETELGEPRQLYGSRCGSAMEAKIDWIAVFSSDGFDDDEHSSPGAVADVLTPFFEAGADFCFDSTTGELYRAAVQRVVFLPTDTPDRIGLCLDETVSTLVYRFQLDEGAATATGWSAGEITTWLSDNIQ